VMPELYSKAYQRYKDEGEALNNEFAAARGMADSDYNRYKDERDRADEQAKFDYTKQKDAYSNLAELIASTGYMPSAEELERAGMSQEQAYALGYEFMRQNKLLPAGAKHAGQSYYNLGPNYAYGPTGKNPGLGKAYL